MNSTLFLSVVKVFFSLWINCGIWSSPWKIQGDYFWIIIKGTYESQIELIKFNPVIKCTLFDFQDNTKQKEIPKSKEWSVSKRQNNCIRSIFRMTISEWKSLNDPEEISSSHLSAAELIALIPGQICCDSLWLGLTGWEWEMNNLLFVWRMHRADAGQTTQD